MPIIELNTDQLELDLENPRISRAIDQREAMERIINEQGLKIVNLAQDISERGLNPIDIMLVMKSPANNGKYTILEGNRRFVVLKTMKNPSVLNDLSINTSVQRRLEKVAANFMRTDVNALPCFELPDRETGTPWIQRRHTGEDEGRGIVQWSGLARARFRDRLPLAVQALDLVLAHGDLSDEQKAAVVDRKFPITSLGRILATPDARARIGLDVKDGDLVTALTLEEAVRPLRRIVLDLLTKEITVDDLRRKEQQVKYVTGLGDDAPDLSKKGTEARPVRTLVEAEPPPPVPGSPKKSRAPRTSDRRSIVSGATELNVTNPKIAEIYTELKYLKLSDCPHAISVLIRVFLEQSVEDYCDRHAIPTTIKTGSGVKFKKLEKKMEEVIAHMVASGPPESNFDGVKRGLSNPQSALSVDFMHACVHNRFVSPTARELEVSWNNAQPLFRRIWP
jgi:hypothetical protein